MFLISLLWESFCKLKPTPSTSMHFEMGPVEGLESKQRALFW
jgi:hypothetical protein